MRIRVSRKICLTSCQSLQFENSIEGTPNLEVTHLLSKDTLVAGDFSITVGEFGKGHLKHNKAYKNRVGQPASCHDQNLTNAVESEG